MRKGLTRVCLVGIALSVLLTLGCVTSGSSDNDEVFNSGGNGSTTTVYDIANNGDLASGGVLIGDGGGPRSPGPGSGVPQPFGPTGGTTGSVTSGTSGGTGTSTGTGGTSGGATTGTTGTGGTSGGSPPGSFTTFLYVPNSTGTTELSILGATSAGALSILPGFNPGGRAQNLGVRPGGQTIYYPFNPGSTLQAFSVDQVTGQLTAVGGPVATGTNPNKLVMDPRTGNFAYVANSGSLSISQYSVATDGQLTSVATPISLTTPGVANFSTIGIEPNGDHVYALASSTGSANIEIFNTPASNGVLSFALSVSAPPLPGQIVFTRGANPTGFAYVSSFTGNFVRAYARNGGNLTPLTPTSDFPSLGFGTNDLLLHPTLTNALYALSTSSGSGSLSFYPVDPTSGTLSSATNIAVTDPVGMAVSANGAFLFVWKDNGSIDIFSLNATTGAPTFQSTFNAGLSAPEDGGSVPPSARRVLNP